MYEDACDWFEITAALWSKIYIYSQALSAGFILCLYITKDVWNNQNILQNCVASGKYYLVLVKKYNKTLPLWFSKSISGRFIFVSDYNTKDIKVEVKRMQSVRYIYYHFNLRLIDNAPLIKFCLKQACYLHVNSFTETFENVCVIISVSDIFVASNVFKLFLSEMLRYDF